MERMRDLLDNIPNALITFGCLIHPELTGEIRMPAQEVKARRSNNLKFIGLDFFHL